MRRAGTPSFADSMMHRFFLREPIANTVTLHGDDVKHIGRVLRLAPGDPIIICDGNGSECKAIIRSIGKDFVECECNTPVPCESEPPVSVTLYQGLPKTGKMETIVQKCVELGVYSVVPMLTQYCVVQPKESFSGRIERWQRVAEEAAKQSRRGIIPQILPLVRLESASFLDYDLVLLAYENERATTLKQTLTGFSGKRIAMLIGPEGGFSEEEVNRLTERGAKSVSLGKRILRTETAGMAMLAQILYEVEK